jgi:hypothetical protein
MRSVNELAVFFNAGSAAAGGNYLPEGMSRSASCMRNVSTWNLSGRVGLSSWLPMGLKGVLEVNPVKWIITE